MPENRAPDTVRRRGRYRRRLRSRIIVSFVLLGFGLTALFAYATSWLASGWKTSLSKT